MALSNIKKYITDAPSCIPIQAIQQGGRGDCFGICLRMVLEYFGKVIAEETLDHFFIKKGTTFSIVPNITDGAMFAKRMGFEVDCYAYNLYITDPQIDATLPAKRLIAKLESKQAMLSELRAADILESTIRCLQAGCNYIIDKPTIGCIDEYLSQNIPVILIVNHSALRDMPGEDLYKTHAIVLTGKQNDKIYFIDPQNAIQESISVERLMFALLQAKIIANSAYMLAIHPKRRVE